jgi:hypothetical protein
MGYNRFIDIEKERYNMFLGGKRLSKIRKPNPPDIISYTVFRSEYGDTTKVAIVLGWTGEECLRILTIPGKKIEKIKWNPHLPNLRIITQDEIKKAISSVSK